MAAAKKKKEVPEENITVNKRMVKSARKPKSATLTHRMASGEFAGLDVIIFETKPKDLGDDYFTVAFRTEGLDSDKNFKIRRFAQLRRYDGSRKKTTPEGAAKVLGGVLMTKYWSEGGKTGRGASQLTFEVVRYTRTKTSLIEHKGTYVFGTSFLMGGGK